jgi:hypothetical protein
VTEAAHKEAMSAPIKPQGRYAAAPGRECTACITPNVCKRDAMCLHPDLPAPIRDESLMGRAARIMDATWGFCSGGKW